MFTYIAGGEEWLSEGPVRWGECELERVADLLVGHVQVDVDRARRDRRLRHRHVRSEDRLAHGRQAIHHGLGVVSLISGKKK